MKHWQRVQGGGPVGSVRRLAFGLGAAAVTAGIALHLPMFLAARHSHYVLRGMTMDGSMVVGMVLIVSGLAAVVFGVAPVRRPNADAGPADLAIEDVGAAGWSLRTITAALAVYALGWGITNFGFLTWLPIDLAGSGRSVTDVSGILTHAALFSLPGAVAVSWTYGCWSSKATMVAVGALTAATLVAFAAAGADLARHTVVLSALLVCLLVSLWGVISVLAPYSAEIYPTRLRARGAGLAPALASWAACWPWAWVSPASRHPGWPGWPR